MGERRREVIEVYKDSSKEENGVASPNERVFIQGFNEGAKSYLPEIEGK
jgi:hypothetical protein